jgi:hypothetical protein
VKKEIGRNKTANYLNVSSIRFKYLDFSMANVGSVFVIKVNMYNPVVWRCMTIFSFHAK